MRYRVRFTKEEESICTSVDFDSYERALEFVELNDSFGRFSWHEIVEVQ